MGEPKTVRRDLGSLRRRFSTVAARGALVLKATIRVSCVGCASISRIGYAWHKDIEVSEQG